jgi:ornithine cyclodeaminase
VYDSVGFAIEDFSVLRYLRDSVNGTEFSIDIDLVVDPDDPKDLFGFALGSGAPVPAL